MKLSNKQIVKYVSLTALLIGCVYFAIYLNNVKAYKQTVSNMTFNEIDFTKIEDGNYIGECNVDFIYAKVKVVVYEGQIETIEILEHRHERGETAEIVIDKIIEEQKIDVDTVSGATNSSRVLKKAVENSFLLKE